ncbi:ATP-binding protein [Haladaptatus sp. CMAA 1911]|uniref:ATP-binding protein n=1 Tax=unclassified Haladaptatus TaxID=2622732 RepID=UPI003754596F
MMDVLGRADDGGISGALGTYRARDGSAGAAVEIDLDGPHAALIVGKRGYGKSYTLGVLVEELAAAAGVSPVVVDPMGAFRTFADVPGFSVVDEPRVSAGALSPRAWCALLGLDHESSAGSLVWQAAAKTDTLAAMKEYVGNADAVQATRRTARNHLALADSWGVFSPDGLTAADCLSGATATILDCSGYDAAPMNAVVRAVAEDLYRARVTDSVATLPWLVVDEAHAFFDGIAAPALRTVLTRGRRPGVSFVAATQRPAALPEDAVSQADIFVAHRLTSRADREALARARPTYMHGSFTDRMPEKPGSALVVDDATESVHAVQIRTRRVEHGGGSPSASALTSETGEENELPRPFESVKCVR